MPSKMKLWEFYLIGAPPKSTLPRDLKRTYIKGQQIWKRINLRIFYLLRCANTTKVKWIWSGSSMNWGTVFICILISRLFICLSSKIMESRFLFWTLNWRTLKVWSILQPLYMMRWPLFLSLLPFWRGSISVRLILKSNRGTLFRLSKIR
jgi:hypothetical protein